jgi:hypothetical protein
VQLAARAATDAATAKLGTPFVASTSSTSDFQHASGVHDAGLELEIGVGDFTHLGGVPVRLLHYFRDLSGRSDLSANAKIADESGLP